MLDEMKTCDPYEDQLSAARFKAERDVALQELGRMRPAFEWVEAKGGLEKIRQQRIDSIPRAAYERKREKLLKHIAECQRALGKRRERIEELEAKNKELANGVEDRIRREWDEEHALRCVCEHLGLDRTDTDWNDALAEMDLRLMPEGYTWPKYENGDPVAVGDKFADGYGGTRRCTSVEILNGEEGVLDALIHWDEDDHCAYLLVNVWDGERVKRPAPKVLDADGVEIHEKCDAWWICEGDERGVHAERLRVETIGPDGLIECSPYNGGTWVYLEPSELYVNKPVPASDGKPLREGETVWHVKTGREYVVVEPSYGKTVVVRLAKYDDAEGEQHAPDHLTHERPEIDSWQRLEDDATISPEAYCAKRGIDFSDVDGQHRVLDEVTERMARDLVRRAKALAGGA